MQWEELKPTISSITGPSAALHTPVRVLVRMGFFDGGEALRVLLYPSRRQVASAARTVLKLDLPPARILMGSLSGLPFPRRFFNLVVAPFPPRLEPDLLKHLRRTAGMLVDGGHIVLHGPVRRNPLGWARHLMSILVHRDGGLPTETDITSWAVRGGFRHVVRIPGGRGSPVTILQATKSLP